jgi:hypothetical protein
MKTTLKSAEETIPFPPGMSREEVLGKFRIVLKELGWSFAENRGGYSATTPLTLKSTGETVEIEISRMEITINSHGGMATFALTSKKYHIANVESLINGFLAISSVASTFDHVEFINKTQKAFALMQAGILNATEFHQTKMRSLNNLSRNSLSIPPTAFLMDLVPLMEAGAITREELNAIKANIL